MANFNINISAPVNQPPVVGDGQRSTSYGVAIVLTRQDFTSNTTPPYSDPENDLPLNLKVLTLPTEGVLKLNGINVVANQEISFVTDIDANLLTYTPNDANAADHSVNFTFSISDAGSQTYSS